MTDSLTTNHMFPSNRSEEHSANPPGMHGLPLQDLFPGLLVVLVVDFNDVGHIVRSQVIITPAPAAAQNQTVKAFADGLVGSLQRTLCVLKIGRILPFLVLHSEINAASETHCIGGLIHVGGIRDLSPCFAGM